MKLWPNWQSCTAPSSETPTTSRTQRYAASEPAVRPAGRHSWSKVWSPSIPSHCPNPIPTWHHGICNRSAHSCLRPAHAAFASRNTHIQTTLACTSPAEKRMLGRYRHPMMHCLFLLHHLGRYNRHPMTCSSSTCTVVCCVSEQSESPRLGTHESELGWL